MSYDYVHDSVRCGDCGFLVLLTMDWSADDAPEHYECSCTKIQPGDDYPDNWTGHERPLSAFGSGGE